MVKENTIQTKWQPPNEKCTNEMITNVANSIDSGDFAVYFCVTMNAREKKRKIMNENCHFNEMQAE